MGDAHAGSGARLRVLEWDSDHYSRRVARVEGPVRDAAELESLLEDALQSQIALLYWYRKEAWGPAPRALLERWGGGEVGGHARFGCALPASCPAPPERSDVTFAREEGPEAAEVVIRLGIAAGAHSRFRTDPGLAPERCDAMYESWIRKSLTGEMADAVLVAVAEGAPRSLVTVSVEGAVGRLGLVATDERMRGRGLARANLLFAHQHMRSRGADRSEVVTQTGNEAACRLYESLGYEVAERGEFVHFHLGALR